MDSVDNRHVVSAVCIAPMHLILGKFFSFVKFFHSTTRLVTIDLFRITCFERRAHQCRSMGPGVGGQWHN